RDSRPPVKEGGRDGGVRGRDHEKDRGSVGPAPRRSRPLRPGTDVIQRADGEQQGEAHAVHGEGRDPAGVAAGEDHEGGGTGERRDDGDGVQPSAQQRTLTVHAAGAVSSAARLKRMNGGAHQLTLPSSRIADGTTSARTRVASTITATAMPKPMDLMSVMLLPSAKPMNTHAMIAAAP